MEHENQTFATSVGKDYGDDEEESFPVLAMKCQKLIEKLKSFQGSSETQDLFSKIYYNRNASLSLTICVNFSRNRFGFVLKRR